MGFTNAEQLRELFLSGGLGFLLGAWYDVFRILRRLLHPRKTAVFLQDLLFFATAAVAVFLFSLAMTEGTVRSYVLIGVAAGFAAYRHTVGYLLLRAVCGILRLLKRIYRRIYSALSVPLAWFFGHLRGVMGALWEKCGKVAKKSGKIFKKGLQPVVKLVYNHRV